MASEFSPLPRRDQKSCISEIPESPYYQDLNRECINIESMFGFTVELGLEHLEGTQIPRIGNIDHTTLLDSHYFVTKFAFHHSDWFSEVASGRVDD